MPLISCPFCMFSREVPPDSIPKNTVSAVCSKCGQKFRLQDALKNSEEETFILTKAPQHYEEQTEDSTASEKFYKETPWEQREELGFLQGILLTMKGVLLHPTLFFKHMAPDSKIKDTIGFAVILYLFLFVLSLLSELLLGLDGLNILHNVHEYITDDPIRTLIVAIGAIVGGIVGAIGGGIVCTIIATAITHLLLILFRAGSGNFKSTLKVTLYCSSAGIFVLIPYIGPVISCIWSFVCFVIGIKEIRSTSYGRVILAMILPLLLLVIFGIFVIFIIAWVR